MLGEFQREEALLHFQRGLVLERANRQEEAVAEYRRAIAHDPHLCEAHSALADHYQRCGLLAKAADELRVVANLDGDFISLFQLGSLLIELGRYDEALIWLQRCQAIDSLDPVIHYQVASAQFLLGNYTDALASLQQPLRACGTDWEVQYLVGNCHFRLGNYDAAHTAFRAALSIAPGTALQRRINERLRAVERYNELGSSNSPRDRIYAEHGVIYLGSAQDDGRSRSEPFEYHFTYPDIGATLQRFLVTYNSLELRPTCVVALDRNGQPLAQALSQLLALPQRDITMIQPADHALLVLAIGREAELLRLALERIPGSAITFCLGLTWLRHHETLPDITGVITRGTCSVPWESELRRLCSLMAPAAQVKHCIDLATTEIMAAIHPTALDAEVAHYYATRRDLRFASKHSS